MSFTDYMGRLEAHDNLRRAQAEEFLNSIIQNTDISDEQIAHALTVLTEKSVTADEICGFVDAMRAHMIRLPFEGEAIDTCGTGGDKSGTFNISTASAILLAAGGVTVAKHGNRAATSKCGSADVLEVMAIPVDLPPQEALKALEGHGFAFLFAPLYHPTLKRLIMVRKQLGFPTVFNLLGPLLNPAGVKRQVIGTFSVKNAELLADVMSQMDYEHGLVITSEDGLDEASLSAHVHVFEVRGKTVTKRRISAAEFGLDPAPVSELTGGDAARNAEIIIQAFDVAGKLSGHQRVIVFNAALGFYVAGKATTIADGVRLAEDVLRSGKPAAKLRELKA